MWALMCLTHPVVCLAGMSGEPVDTLAGIALQEITVKVKPVVSKSDGNSYIPSAEKKRMALSGLDLLQKMQLPRVSVNAMTGEVTVSGAKTVRMCINGVEATSSEISAIRPDDVVRVEYHDNPGARYAGADAVIDYITRHHDSGGNISAEGMNALGNGKWAAMDNISGRYSRGPSSVSVNAGVFGMRRDNWVRDYEEVWNYPDGPVRREEKGLPVSIGMTGVSAAVNYSLRNERKYFFNLRAAYDFNHVPDKEEGDRHTMLTTSQSDEVTEIYEHTEEKSHTPSVGLFYRHFFGRSGTLTANLTGRYMHSGSAHEYRELVQGEPSVYVLSDVSGRKYSILAEAYHEVAFGVSRLTAGARHSQSYTSNIYSGTQQTACVGLHQAESSIFGEYTVKLGNWDLLANLTAERLSVAQGDVDFQKYALLPSVGVSYEPVPAVRMRYDFSLDRMQPSLAALSDIELMVQPGLMRRGNPELESFNVIDRRFTFSYFHDIVSADVMLDYRDERNPVMPFTYYDGGNFVMTYANQPSFQRLCGELTVAVRPWGDHLSIALSPSLNRYFSRGDSYRHIRNIFHLGISVDFSYAGWTFSGNIMTGAATDMYGEEIINEKDMNMMLVGYKKANWSLQAGVFNAFMKDYWMKTENLSQQTPYVSKAHCGKNAYAVVRFSLNFDFGKKSADSDFRLQHATDNDSGIMNGLK